MFRSSVEGLSISSGLSFYNYGTKITNIGSNKQRIIVKWKFQTDKNMSWDTQFSPNILSDCLSLWHAVTTINYTHRPGIQRNDYCLPGLKMAVATSHERYSRVLFQHILFFLCVCSFLFVFVPCPSMCSCPSNIFYNVFILSLIFSSVLMSSFCILSNLEHPFTFFIKIFELSQSYSCPSAGTHIH